MAVIFGRAVFKRRSVPQHSCSNLQLVNLIVEGGFGTDHKGRRCFFLRACKVVPLILMIAPLISAVTASRTAPLTFLVSAGLCSPGAHRPLGPLHAGQLHLPSGNGPVAGAQPQRSSHLVDTRRPLKDRLRLHQEPHHLHQVGAVPPLSRRKANSSLLRC